MTDPIDTDIEWGDPPPMRPRGPNPVISPIVDALKSRPGQWARVRQALTLTAASQSVQRLKKLGCEATQRRASADTVDVWARWPEGETASDD